MASVADAANTPVLDRETGYPSARAAWWTVAVLSLLYLFSFLDRQIINLMVDDIKHTLEITDFQISLLQGLSFALLYATMGLPFGWATDHLSRRHVIFGGLLVWSIAASACGLARNFWHLLFARFGVGAGEAALTPAAYSLIGDSFPRERRAVAMSVFTVGAGFGAAASLAIGGVLIHAIPDEGMTFPYLGTLAGWQIVFIITGLPCLLVSWLVYTMRDPGRRAVTEEKSSPVDALKFIARDKRFFFCHFIGFSLLSLCHYAIPSWIPAHLHRNFGWNAMDVGLALAVINVTVCTTGAVALGYVADSWFRSGRTDAHIRMFLVVGVLQTIFAVVFIGFGGLWGALAGTALILSMAPYNGIAVTALQLVTPNQLRGQVTALYLLLHTLLGVGLGPSVVAAITDFFFKDPKMVNWSIAGTFVLVMPISMFLLMGALKPMREKLAAQG